MVRSSLSTNTVPYCCVATEVSTLLVASPGIQASLLRSISLMLRAVEQKYKHIAANNTELAKYTLAAYNAGASRIADCVRYARHLGVDVSYWENVAAVIPDMKHDSIAALDAIKLGTFHGRETVSYVRRVNRYYKHYRHICP